MKLSLIVAMDRNGLIGRDGGLPWPRIPEDMRLFKRLTMGKPVIVGRKTFNAIGYLPFRYTMILSSRGRHKSPVDDTLRAAAEIATGDPGEPLPIYVVGGAETYAAFRDHVTEAHVTLIDGAYEGDTYFPFPLLDSPEWEPAADPVPLCPSVTYHKLRRKAVS